MEWEKIMKRAVLPYGVHSENLVALPYGVDGETLVVLPLGGRDVVPRLNYNSRRYRAFGFGKRCRV